MKTSIIALACVSILFCGPAFADSAKPPAAPSCGKTAEECQKQVDALRAQAESLSKQVGVWRQLNDEANNRFVSQAAATP